MLHDWLRSRCSRTLKCHGGIVCFLPVCRKVLQHMCTMVTRSVSDQLVERSNLRLGQFISLAQVVPGPVKPDRAESWSTTPFILFLAMHEIYPHNEEVCQSTIIDLHSS